MSNLLTQKEIAEKLGCSTRTLSRLAKKEDFPKPAKQYNRTTLLYDEIDLPKIQTFLKPVGRPESDKFCQSHDKICHKFGQNQADQKVTKERKKKNLCLENQ